MIKQKVVICILLSILLIIIIINVFLLGCASIEKLFVKESSNSVEVQSSAESNQNAVENTLNSSMENQINTGTEIDSYCIYGLYSKENAFDKEISENQIDKDFDIAFNQATTTQQFDEVEKIYIEKWKDEMQTSISKLKIYLDDTDFNYFIDSQQEWEKQILDTTESDYKIILNKNYGISLGSSFHWTWLNNLRLEYRDRVIHIKYIIYLFQNRDK